MKRPLLLVAALACLGRAALAGPNAGGVLAVSDPGVAYQGAGLPYCTKGVDPPTCEAAMTEHDGGDRCVWKVYAVFKVCSFPRLKALDFGVNYDAWPTDPTGLVILDHGACIGDFANGAQEYPGPGWPSPGTNDVVIFQFAQTSTIDLFYWFAGYAYDAGSNLFALTGGKYGGMFADDSTPPLQDPIVGYGTLGFNQPGYVPCQDENLGACCAGTDCTITCEDLCHGTWLGPDFPCEPNPCKPTPVAIRSWGRIKSGYR